MNRHPILAMAVFLTIGWAVAFAGAWREAAAQSRESGSNPLNASYEIEGREIRLKDGRSEMEVAPGSATKTRIFVFGSPVYGDLDGDGAEDAAMLLVCDPGGSGTFYYVAACLNVNGTCRGTNAVLLGDRVAPRDVRIRNGLVIAGYADRRPEEPMAARPTMGRTKYLTLKNGELAAIEPLGEGEQVLEGWVTIGHEVRSFRPCSAGCDLWLLGHSQALNEIIAAYRKTLPSPAPYSPLFMTLAGRFAEPPAESFGEAFEGAFLATQLVQVWPKGNCRGDHIVVDFPMPGTLVSSPLSVRGRARGTWFFEGDFPVALKDPKGRMIAKGFCTAKGEWMTRDFVPFEGTIEFKRPEASGTGTLILEKDNPTGLPKHDDAVEIPVFFK